MYCNFESVKTIKIKAIRMVLSLFAYVIFIFCLSMLVSCGAPLEGINDAGGEVIEDMTTSGKKINKSVDKVTGTLGGESAKASRVAYRSLEQIRAQAADNPEYIEVINNNDELLEEICLEHDERIMTKEEYTKYCEN